VKRRIFLAIFEVATLGMISSCALTPSCPVTGEQAASGDFEVIGDDTFVGTGYAIRFVPAPDADARGYDLNVARWIHGRPKEPGIFLLSEEIRGIGRGQPVLIIVEPTDKVAYVRGVCEPLQPISEDDVLRE
jgi:hypothetical protein